MKDPNLLAAIALIICIPVLFAAFGGSRGVGLGIGVVLVVGGLLWTVLGSRRDRGG